MSEGSVPELRRRRASSGVDSIGGSSVSSSISPSSLTEAPPPDGPRAIQIVSSLPDHTFELDERALEDVLLSPEVRDKKVVVVSVAGALRKGKSFLLGFLLRYLFNEGITGNPDWLGEDTEPLTGFHWRGGVKSDTTGILLWSKPYIATIPSTGEKVAILLLDTQGAFDNQSTLTDCATVFGLSTMVASVQVYNLSMMIQENDLQHLNVFTKYGRLAMGGNVTIKPFQSLCFLVRDWSYPDEYGYGSKGGKAYLEEVLQVKNTQPKDIKMVREHIRSCFDPVSCFLLPHPGLKVAITNRTFDGRLTDIDNEFKQHLRELAPHLLAQHNLVVKKINGNPVTGSELLEYFKAYMKIFRSDELPRPRSILEATAEVNNLAAMAAAFDKYNTSMEELCGVGKPYLLPRKLEEKHSEIMQACLEEFRSTRMMGGEAFSRPFEEELERQIGESYENFKKQNEMKYSPLQAFLFATAATATVAGAFVAGTVVAGSVGGVAGVTLMVARLLPYFR